MAFYLFYLKLTSIWESTASHYTFQQTPRLTFMERKKTSTIRTGIMRKKKSKRAMWSISREPTGGTTTHLRPAICCNTARTLSEYPTPHWLQRGQPTPISGLLDAKPVLHTH